MYLAFSENTFYFVATVSCCDTVDVDTITHNGHGGTSSIFSFKRTQNDQVSDFVSAEIDLSDLSSDETISGDVSVIFFLV